MSAHPSHSPIPGDNPNYHAELAGTTSQSGSSQPSTIQQGQYPPPPPGPPPSSGADSTYYPPPPPGPPPATQLHDDYPPPPGLPPSHLEQYYYPPPPPGPPPNQDYASQEGPNYPPPPSYSEIGDGPGVVVTDEKPPILPPRPVSSQGAQSAPHFPPPPTEASLPHAAASLHPQQHQQQPSTPTTDAPSSSTTKVGFGRKLYEWGTKVGAPINKLTNKLGSEAFFPSAMDKECDKAARILKSFCKDGFYTTASTSTSTSTSAPAPAPASASTQTASSTGPSGKSKALVKIPQSAIANAKGLAIFTTLRTGFHISGAGGSGLVVARLPDGSWSPPAGFLVHTIGAGFVAGLDIYDCVCVLNTSTAVEAFTKPRLSLGGEIAVAAGPVGAGTSVDAPLGKGQKPVWSYMKSRGLYGGVQVDGTVIVQRPDANAVFYGVDKIEVDKILKGEVGNGNQNAKNQKGDMVMWPEGGKQLVEVLKAVEGKRADEGVINKLGSQPTPGDLAPTPVPSPGPEQQHFPRNTNVDEGGK
ncbi:DUF500-domain-containing protein [Daldinia caldariorum]|uniref:DUF500-domain-containing protein n=1 Tax=Daldinia caldariorum TaxID=326644 RepID=UPI002008D2A0|nr:DUF500-domain-containing protein [Daldinia caldariorum]KAI1463467.1 DUF500-domain-containing protein [Daldinia caldariorum]